jgi:hypothetical protein
MDLQEQAGIATSPEVEIIDKIPSRKTPKKRRARRPRGPLDVSFLCRSKRLNTGLEGFHDAASAGCAQNVATDQDVAVDQAVHDVVAEVEPIVVLTPEPAPSSLVVYFAIAAQDNLVAPHLPLETVQAMGTGFLKMQPEDVSDVALLASDDIDE